MTSTFQTLPPPTPPASPGGGGAAAASSGNHPSTDAHSGGFGTVFLVLAVILVVSALACFLGRLCNRRTLSRQSKPGAGRDHDDHHHRHHQQQQSSSRSHHSPAAAAGGPGGGGGGRPTDKGGDVGISYKFPNTGPKDRDMEYGYPAGPKKGAVDIDNDIEYGFDPKKPIPKIKIPASRYLDAGRGQSSSRRDDHDDDNGGGFGRGGGGGRPFTMMGSPANYR